MSDAIPIAIISGMSALAGAGLAGFITYKVTKRQLDAAATEGAANRAHTLEMAQAQHAHELRQVREQALAARRASTYETLVRWTEESGTQQERRIDVARSHDAPEDAIRSLEPLSFQLPPENVVVLSAQLRTVASDEVLGAFDAWTTAYGDLGAAMWLYVESRQLRLRGEEVPLHDDSRALREREQALADAAASLNAAIRRDLRKP